MMFYLEIMEGKYSTESLLVFKHIDQSANMRQDFHHEGITLLQSNLGVLADANTRWCAGDDQGASWQSRALREEGY